MQRAESGRVYVRTLDKYTKKEPLIKRLNDNHSIPVTGN